MSRRNQDYWRRLRREEYEAIAEENWEEHVRKQKERREDREKWLKRQMKKRRAG